MSGDNLIVARVLEDERGAKAVEYGLTAALVGLASLVALLWVVLT